MYINRGFTDEDTIIYNLPDDVLTNILPEMDKKYKTVFGEYNSKITLEGKKLTYYRKFIMTDGTYPASNYTDFYRFITDVNSADGLKIILNLKK